MSDRNKTITLMAARVQNSLAATAWTDLARRPAEDVVGPKALWAVVIAVNFVGSIAYLHERSPSRAHRSTTDVTGQGGAQIGHGSCLVAPTSKGRSVHLRHGPRNIPSSAGFTVGVRHLPEADRSQLPLPDGLVTGAGRHRGVPAPHGWGLGLSGYRTGSGTGLASAAWAAARRATGIRSGEQLT
jgi:hypothetical protein